MTGELQSDGGNISAVMAVAKAAALSLKNEFSLSDVQKNKTKKWRPVHWSSYLMQQ